MFFETGGFDKASRLRTERLVGEFAVLCAAMPFLFGCSRGPTGVDVPDWDPSALAERILAELDTNGDAQAEAAEWVNSPGLAAGARYIDTDQDGRLSQEEIEARFERYRKVRIGLQPRSFRVTYKGRPVADAEMVFLPEPFLEGLIEPARGKTDVQGIVTPQTEGQDLLGMRPGYYRVQIISSRSKIPEKYKRDAILGAEASPVSDNPFASDAAELRLND